MDRGLLVHTPYNEVRLLTARLFPVSYNRSCSAASARSTAPSPQQPSSLAQRPVSPSFRALASVCNPPGGKTLRLREQAPKVTTAALSARHQAGTKPLLIDRWTQENGGGCALGLDPVPETSQDGLGKPWHFGPRGRRASCEPPDLSVGWARALGNFWMCQPKSVVTRHRGCQEEVAPAS